MEKEKKFLIPDAEIVTFYYNLDIITTSEVGDDNDEDLPPYEG